MEKLVCKHAELEQQIHEAYFAHSSDAHVQELKKQKLHISDMIMQYKTSQQDSSEQPSYNRLAA